ncbi:MAG: hypothetical protein IKV85_00030 [Ruminococcus sp.]|nr:hypothetical protein [Ruminococcus sp.]
MKKLNYYGCENGSIKPVSADMGFITDLNEMYEVLRKCWCAETCPPRMREKWTRENPSLGQCSITAFLVQDYFGGEVYGILRNGGNYHCYNFINGHIFDLTSEQFGEEILDYSNRILQSREVHFSKNEKKERYELLKRKICEFIK